MNLKYDKNYNSNYEELCDNIKTLSHDAYHNESPSQITIDLIEDTESKLNDEESTDSFKDNDTLGAFIYNVECLIEVLNPEKTRDVELINKISTHLNKWYTYLKSQNERN